MRVDLLMSPSMIPFTRTEQNRELTRLNETKSCLIQQVGWSMMSLARDIMGDDEMQMLSCALFVYIDLLGQGPTALALLIFYAR